ncbi:hypothetical protein GCM10010176_075920 [Nonomuraea spiralis]|nr:hypothetical protein GCM10010176_075920 [Nonomuraea spiralis]
MPSAPAAETAAASRPALTPAMGALTRGTVSPNRSVSHVRTPLPFRLTRYGQSRTTTSKSVARGGQRRIRTKVGPVDRCAGGGCLCILVGTGPARGLL